MAGKKQSSQAGLARQHTLGMYIVCDLLDPVWKARDICLDGL